MSTTYFLLFNKYYIIMMGQGDKKIRIRRTNEQLDKEVISEFEKLVVIVWPLASPNIRVEISPTFAFRFVNSPF